MNPEIIFDISPDFISPFYPKRGEKRLNCP
jgi:hypothetical protein